jgi:hypothetical protein
VKEALRLTAEVAQSSYEARVRRRALRSNGERPGERLLARVRDGQGPPLAFPSFPEKGHGFRRAETIRPTLDGEYTYIAASSASRRSPHPKRS